MTTKLSQMTNAEGRPYEILYFRPLTVYYFIFILAEVFAVGLLWDTVRIIHLVVQGANIGLRYHL